MGTPGRVAAPSWFTTDALVGLLAVATAAVAGYVGVLWLVKIDDGLELLITLPLSACAVALAAAVRAWGAEAGSEVATGLRIWLGSVVAWAALGLVLVAGAGSVARAPGGVVAFTMFGGAQTLVGTIVGVAPVVLVRRFDGWVQQRRSP